MKTILLTLTLVTLTMLACSPAYAQDPAVTGHPLVDQVFAWLGSVVAALTVLATLLPRTWRATQLIARFAMDIRGILTPNPSDDPSWVKKATKGLLVFTAFGLLVSCASLKPIARTVNDAATVLCELYGAENPELLDGASVSDYCAVKENLDPFIDSVLAAKQSLKASLNAEPVSE